MNVRSAPRIIAAIAILFVLFAAPHQLSAAPALLFYSLLEDALSVTQPTIGSGTGATLKTTPVGDFPRGKVGRGIRIDAQDEYVRFPTIVGSSRNIELDTGAIEFWYKPAYNHNDNLLHKIFRVGVDGKPGMIDLHKRAASKGSDLELSIRDFQNIRRDTQVSGADYKWLANTWVLVQITWNTPLNGDTQVARIYLNGVELKYKKATTTRVKMPAENPAHFIYVGNSSNAGTGQPASGVIDEFKVYARSFVPEALPPPTATPTLRASSTPAFTSTFTPTRTRTLTPTRTRTLIPSATFTPLATQLPTLTRTPSATVPRPTTPDIILILSDDQGTDIDMAQYMPLTVAAMGPNALIFDNFFATTPTCCPSRSTILTGQYSHHHGVLDNEPDGTFPINGGAQAFHADNTLPIWLKQAGYRTSLVGKYLNGYCFFSPQVPPGWDDFHAFSTCSNSMYYGYQLNNNGVIKDYTQVNSANYSTNVFATMAADFINTTPTSTSLFLMFTPPAPHWPATSAPLDVSKFSDVTYAQKPSFNEADVTDKPQWIQELPAMTDAHVEAMNAFNRDQLRSLQALDRAVSQIFTALAQTGRLSNTVVIFASDNGIAKGEHRWFKSAGENDDNDAKECVYDECVKVPLRIRLPTNLNRAACLADPQACREDALVGNIDLAPTITALAGTSIPSTFNGNPFPVDGVSLLPLIQNPGTAWRDAILLEQLRNEPKNSFSAIRTSEYVYAKYQNGERELYEFATDPYQLNNRADDPALADVLVSLATRLTVLKK